ncbi:MAG: 50S ribosomal protein L19e [Candidatus Bathyarchaeota archaeon]|nr:50S ribosomal protein L19e [Candidatus Bathyarchaeota archaeon]MDH5494700.1 50S ribosomal protein L19e [Candidatus Bathyarchaeota archaeon]
MSLKSQRRLAAGILKVGQNRVWIDPARIDDVEIAITREEIIKLIHEKAIQPRPEKGISRSRARALHAQKKKGLRKGPGKRSKSRTSKKEVWMKKIRALRKRLRELKEKRVIAESTYRQFYKMAGSGVFESVAELEHRIKVKGLWRTR